jgi:acetyl esterase/lipase
MPTEDRSILDRVAPEPAVDWRYGPESDQVADLYFPEGTTHGPTVVLIHGGFWRPGFDRLHLRPMAAAIASLGHPTALVEYRRDPGEPDHGLLDIRTALRALDTVVDTTNGVLLIGHSAGGHLALVVAVGAEPPVTGCLALAPVADLLLADDLDLDADAVRAYLGGPAQERSGPWGTGLGRSVRRAAVVLRSSSRRDGVGPRLRALRAHRPGQ